MHRGAAILCVKCEHPQWLLLGRCGGETAGGGAAEARVGLPLSVRIAAHALDGGHPRLFQPRGH